MKIKFFFTIICACAISAGFSSPGPSPKIKASDVAKLLEYKIEGKSYIARMWLIHFGKRRLWIVAVADPKESYEFYKVNMDKEIRILEGQELNEVMSIVYSPAKTTSDYFKDTESLNLTEPKP